MKYEELKSLYETACAFSDFGKQAAEDALYFMEHWMPGLREELSKKISRKIELADSINYISDKVNFEFTDADDERFGLSEIRNYEHDILDRAITVKVLVSDMIQLYEESTLENNYICLSSLVSGLSLMQTSINYAIEQIDKLVEKMSSDLDKQEEEDDEEEAADISLFENSPEYTYVYKVLEEAFSYFVSRVDKEHKKKAEAYLRFILEALESFGNGNGIKDFSFSIYHRYDEESRYIDFYAEKETSLLQISEGGTVYTPGAGHDSYTNWDWSIWGNGTEQGYVRLNEDSIYKLANLGSKLSISLPEDFFAEDGGDDEIMTRSGEEVEDEIVTEASEDGNTEKEGADEADTNEELRHFNEVRERCMILFKSVNDSQKFFDNCYEAVYNQKVGERIDYQAVFQALDNLDEQILHEENSLGSIKQENIDLYTSVHTGALDTLVTFLNSLKRCGKQLRVLAEGLYKKSQGAYYEFSQYQADNSNLHDLITENEVIADELQDAYEKLINSFEMFRLSANKTICMNACAMLWMDIEMKKATYAESESALHKAYENLYYAMNAMEYYQQVMELYNITSDDLLDISKKVIDEGYGNAMYKNRDYLPVGVVSLGQAPEFMFKYKAVMDHLSGSEYARYLITAAELM